MAKRSAEHYRVEAARCRALAEEAILPSLRSTLLEVADTYEKLARQIDDLSRNGHWPTTNPS